MLNASIIETLIEIEQFLQNDMDKTRAELASSEAGAKLLIIILSVSSVLIGLLVAYFISRSIANPVKKVTAGLSEIAGGNLAVEPIRIKNKDEVGDMATGI